MTDAEVDKLKDGIQARDRRALARSITLLESCLLYTSDAADE